MLKRRDFLRATLISASAALLPGCGEKPELASYWSGFGVREGAKAVPNDIDFWIAALERDGKLPKGKFKAADLLYEPGAGVKSN